MGSESDDDGADATERVTVLTFDLEETGYCVRADSVVSVLDVAADSALADTDDPWDAGTVTAAGERIRVVDLPRVFGSSTRISDRIDEPKLLVFAETDSDGRHYGWLVDAVETTTTVRVTSLESPETTTNHVKGRLEVGTRALVWLDGRTIND
ncbi:chemotaxis protein CheW [Natrinema longum]|uniref:Chemotaxis protein CheW n=1 Tax=Natrinema longum TaxID=370324 RepID=A0A8A2U7X7_9EURY|nr:chemotaxis protein CheW [Natrinema longum]MBZ6493853.1 chemotaxis protein CheW [Natrinema longum]QSW84811.1 chemotaxis protein CheW [Natrinema longum]